MYIAYAYYVDIGTKVRMPRFIPSSDGWPSGDRNRNGCVSTRQKGLRGDGGGGGFHGSSDDV